MYNCEFIRDKVIFEFGSGIAIPSLTALKMKDGARSVILQELNIPSLLEMQKIIFSSNGLPTTEPAFYQLPLRWGEFPENFIVENSKKIGAFIAADCLYERNDFADLVATIAFLMSHNPGIPFIMCYQDRNLLYSIDELFEYWGLRSELIPLDSFAFDGKEFAQMNDSSVVEDFPVDRINEILVMLEVRLKGEDFIFAK